MIDYNGVGDFYRFYLETQRANAAFHLAYIGDDFHSEHKEEFDPSYMGALYRYGFDKAAKGYAWLGCRRDLTATVVKPCFGGGQIGPGACRFW